MRNMPSVPTSSADPLLENIRHRLVDRIWLGVLIIALIGTPASISRASTTGWLPMYTFHIAMAISVVAVYLARRNLSYLTKSAILLCVFYAIGTVGILTLGLLGAGLWWLVMSSLLASTLLSQRASLVISASAFVIVVISGYAFTSGYFRLPFDANTYARDATAWLSFLVAASIMPFIVFQSIALFQKSTIDLIGEINRQRSEIEKMASHDQLTGLPLLNLAQDRLHMALNDARRTGRKVALLFIDLDEFKSVNDLYGHEVGDHVLKVTSARILQSMREVDTVARIGGDEFILILGNLGNEAEAALVAERAIDEISKPIHFADMETAIGASIGIALFPDDAAEAGALRRAADKAMYAAKKSGKKTFFFASTTI